MLFLLLGHSISTCPIYNIRCIECLRSHDMSPVQILVKEQARAWYHFLTTTCAIIGGVFTVAGILDAILYSTFKLAKKLELGKQM